MVEHKLSRSQYLTRQAVMAFRAGELEKARTQLIEAVDADEYNELAWLWLSRIVDSRDDLLVCFENVLTINPGNDRAKVGLAILIAGEKEGFADEKSVIEPNSRVYTPGGTIGSKGKLYILRKADDELYSRVLEGELCYVLTARQMGKSSLMAYNAQRFRTAGLRVAIVDLQRVGGNIQSLDQFYAGMLKSVITQLKIQVDLNAWWNNNNVLTQVQRFDQFLREVVLEQVKERIVIFIDEIDTVRSFREKNLKVDDFFALIRGMHLARAEDEAYQRLNFVLIGVAQPNDLIEDEKRTPFNIGQRIELTDFSLEEAASLREGLGLSPEEAQRVVNWIMFWTNGHPYLSQKLCKTIAEHGARTKEEVDNLVERLFFNPRSPDDNIGFVSRMLTARDVASNVLRLYYKLYSGRQVWNDDENVRLREHLKLSGVVRVESGQLVISNRIYERHFDLNWIRDTLKDQFDTPLEVVEVGQQREDEQLLVEDGPTEARVVTELLPNTKEIALPTLSQSSNPFELLNRLEFQDNPSPNQIEEVDELFSVGPFTALGEQSNRISTRTQEYDDWVSRLDLTDKSIYTDDELEDNASGFGFEAEDMPTLPDMPSLEELAPSPKHKLLARTRTILRSGKTIGLLAIAAISFFIILEIAAYLGVTPIISIGTLTSIVILGMSIIEVRSGRDLFEERLERYEQGYQSFLDVEEEEETPKVDRKALDALDKALSKRRVAQPLVEQLERADLKISVVEYLALHISMTLIGYSLSYFVFFRGDIVLATLIGFGGFVLPSLYVVLVINQREASFRKLFPDVLNFWVRAARSGFSSLQAIESIAQTLPEPVRGEFRRVVQETQMGISFTDALKHLTTRIRSTELRFITQAIEIQQETGSNIAELMETLSGFIHARREVLIYINQRVRPLYQAVCIVTAVMVALPWVFFPSYFRLAIETSIGKSALLIAFSLAAMAMLCSGQANAGLRRFYRNFDENWKANRSLTFDVFINFALFISLNLLGVPFPVAACFGAVALLTIIGLGFQFFILIVPTSIIVIWLLKIDLTTTFFPLPATHNIFTTLGRGVIDSLTVISPSLFLCLALSGSIGILMLVYISLRNTRRRDPLQERLAQFGERELPDSLRDIEISLPFRDRIIIPALTPFGRLAASFSPIQQFESIAGLLDRAGLNHNVLNFLLLRTTSTFGMTGMTYLIIFQLSLIPASSPTTLLLVIGMTLLGYWYPNLLVHQRIWARKRKIRGAMADVFALCAVCMEAGLSFDMSVSKVFLLMDNELAVGFGRTLKEIRLGKPRREAFEDMSERLNIPEFSDFINIVVQTDELGTDMSRALYVKTVDTQYEQISLIRPYIELEFLSRLLLEASIPVLLLAPLLTRIITSG